MADHAALSDLLGEYGITFNGVRTASVLGLEFPVVAVGTHTPADVCGFQVLDCERNLVLGSVSLAAD